MENKNLRCLRCENSEMRFLKREDIQLGKQSFWHDWNHILHGSLDVDIYVCPKCGKLEFFAPQPVMDSMRVEEICSKPGEIVARRCTECNRIVPKDLTCCPGCGADGAALLPQVKCPLCGAIHDFDDPKCPNCKNEPK